MLTVLFATFNGAHTLPRALDGLTRVREPAGGWRLVVIDNASTDATPSILQRYRSRLPLVVVNEPARGQNAARNAGLGACDGDLIVFTDDDVVAEPDWLCNLRRAADVNPECDVFGGAIVPLWEQEPPAWIAGSVPLSAAFAITPCARRSGAARGAECFGPNFAVRAHYFTNGLRFRTDLGPAGRSYPMGGETELLWRLELLGARSCFVADAVVHHIVRPWQTTSAWMRRRAFNFGRGQHHVHHRSHPPGTAATFFGFPRWRLRYFPMYPWAVIAAHAQRNRTMLAEARWALWCELGWLWEERRLRPDRLPASRAGLSLNPPST